MSRISQSESFEFLIEKNLLPRYLIAAEHILLRKINKKFEKSDILRLWHYISHFGTPLGFKLIITVLRCQSNNSKDQKLFRFMSHSSAMQTMLVNTIRKRLEPSQSLSVWQLMACIAPLSTNNFAILYKEEQHLKVVSLLNQQQKLFFIKNLFELTKQSKPIKECYSEKNINAVVLSCIKNHLDDFLEFLLRLDIGSWYEQKHLLTEDDPENQHPLLACFNVDNLKAFQFFLTYAEHLLRIYHQFSGAPDASPPMNSAALRRKFSFIELVAQQKPESLDQLNICQGNIAHSALNLFPSYRDPNLRQIMYTLAQYRPTLFAAKDIEQRTPKELLPKEFFTDPQFQLSC